MAMPAALLVERHMLKKTLLGAVLMSSMLAGSIAWAQEWPSRAITIIVGSSPGGTADTMSRALANKLSERLGQSVIIENKPGAAGILGLQAAARAEPDGYTFVLGWPSSIVSTQFLYKDLPFNAKRDFVPVSLLSVNEMVLAVNANLPVKTPKELVEWIKQQPKGSVSYGSYGTGTYGHLAPAYLSKQEDLGAVHVPYKSEMPMLLATSTNEVAFSIGVAPTVKRLQETGKVRVIGLFSRERSKLHPEVPTIMESGLTDDAYSVSGWYGLFAPAKTPPAIVSKMEKTVMEIMRLPETQESLSALGMPLIGSSAQELGQAWDTEIPIYEKLTKSAGVTLN